MFFGITCATAMALAGQNNGFLLQVIKQPTGKILLEYDVKKGDFFYIDYIHSSDHTPVHDTFEISEKAEIVLIEEVFDWYGSGLEFHPNAPAVSVVMDGGATRVCLKRVFHPLRLRVGRVASHVLTYKNRSVPLLSIAQGGDAVEIRLVEIRR